MRGGEGTAYGGWEGRAKGMTWRGEGIRMLVGEATCVFIGVVSKYVGCLSKLVMKQPIRERDESSDPREC